MPKEKHIGREPRKVTDRAWQPANYPTPHGRPVAPSTRTTSAQIASPLVRQAWGLASRAADFIPAIPFPTMT